MNILYIGRETQIFPKDGGEYGGIRNQTMLIRLYGENCIDFLYVKKIPNYRHLVNSLLFRSYGETCILRKKVYQKIGNNYDFIFLDGAYYGVYAKLFSQKGYNVVTYCHNVEYDYYLGKYRVNKSIPNYIMVKYIKFNEQLSLKYSNHVIALNNRDSINLYLYYKRHADLILPICYDVIPIEKLKKTISTVPHYILFVGANQYANIEGISWFIKEVSPYSNIPLYVVGSWCVSLSEWFSQ
jgi:hypothetical protein